MPETKINDTEKQASEPETPASDSIQVDPISPTRFGDWEKNGRCIDF